MTRRLRLADCTTFSIVSSEFRHYLRSLAGVHPLYGLPSTTCTFLPFFFFGGRFGISASVSGSTCAFPTNHYISFFFFFGTGKSAAAISSGGLACVVIISRQVFDGVNFS